MIYYFSGTGNTKWVATSIANQLQCEAIDICKADFEASDTKEPIGFAFPIHGWQPPHIMRQFVRSLPHSIFADRYIFAVCTCGDETGLALDIFRKELQSRGMSLRLSVSVQMPNTYVCLPFMDTDPKDVETTKLEMAGPRIAMIVDKIRRREEGDYLSKGTAPWLLTHVIGEYFNRRMVNDRKFEVITQQCIHCGKCASVCPVGNISNHGIDNSFTPRWNHDNSCTGCLACYHHCPRHAILFGNITRKRGQYFFGQ